MKCTNCEAPLTSPKGVTLTICPFCQTDNDAKVHIAASKGEAALREEFLRRGEALYKDKGVLSALISDFFTDNSKLQKVLRLAVQENIASKILELSPHSVGEQKIRISSIVSYFANDYGMGKTRVEEAVRVLAFGAGLAGEVLVGIEQDTSSNSQHADSPIQTSSSTRIDKQSKHNIPQVGSIYPFGGYDWRVLDIQEGKALLLSENILERRKYHKVSEDITWEQCALRQYLNSDFLNNLDQVDRNRISETRINNPDNLWYGTKGGNYTFDKFFLLNIDEVDQYFGNSGDYRSKRRKDHQGNSLNYGWYIYNNDNRDRVASYNGAASGWWLRSPGDPRDYAAIVIDDGFVRVGGGSVSSADGVRPALWLNL